MLLTIRSFDPEVRDLLEKRIHTLAEGQAASYGMSVTLDYERGYEPTVNHAAETEFIRKIAARVVGESKVHDLPRPMMGSEDFAYMLAERPGSYFYLGTRRSDRDPPLHHPRFDFNDDVLPIGVNLWVELAEAWLAQ
jgi:hippurate hydrolase